MNQTFTFKTVLLALLVMICCAAKAETASYSDNDFTFKIDLETQEASLSGYHGNATSVVVPEKITYKGKEYKVMSFEWGCFSGRSSLVSIEIPSSVTSLGNNCFYDCSSLVSIEIPSSVASLGKECFYGCSSLASIAIPSSVTSLEFACFSGCSSLASITIPSSVTSLGNNCFSECSSLVSIVIPSSVTSLGEYCFGGCSSLTSIEIPSSVTSLGLGCFSNCSSLVSIAIPSSVTSLGVYCFNWCSSLASIEIPSSVTSIGSSCFSNCSSLETIVVNANNPRYDSREGCNAIIETASNTMITGCKNTFIPSSVTSLGNQCFFGCSSLVSIAIPSSVTSLGNLCFADCTSLVSIAIPSSVTSIGDYCFYNCYSLASIAIPSSVTSLGYRCFSYCSSLKTVICRMENVESESGDLFNGTPIEEAVLYVPKTLLATYQNITPWSSFGTILPLTEEVELGISDISKPVFSLRSDNGSVILSGLADGTPVSYYSIDGRLLSRTSVDKGFASFSVKPNSIVTVKAGKQSFKVCVK